MKEFSKYLLSSVLILAPLSCKQKAEQQETQTSSVVGRAVSAISTQFSSIFDALSSIVQDGSDKFPLAIDVLVGAIMPWTVVDKATQASNVSASEQLRLEAEKFLMTGKIESNGRQLDTIAEVETAGKKEVIVAAIELVKEYNLGLIAIEQYGSDVMAASALNNEQSKAQVLQVAQANTAARTFAATGRQVSETANLAAIYQNSNVQIGLTTGEGSSSAIVGSINAPSSETPKFTDLAKSWSDFWQQNKVPSTPTANNQLFMDKLLTPPLQQVAKAVAPTAAKVNNGGSAPKSSGPSQIIVTDDINDEEAKKIEYGLRAAGILQHIIDAKDSESSYKAVIGLVNSIEKNESYIKDALIKQSEVLKITWAKGLENDLISHLQPVLGGVKGITQINKVLSILEMRASSDTQILPSAIISNVKELAQYKFPWDAYLKGLKLLNATLVPVSVKAVQWAVFKWGSTAKWDGWEQSVAEDQKAANDVAIMLKSIEKLGSTFGNIPTLPLRLVDRLTAGLLGGVANIFKSKLEEQTSANSLFGNIKTIVDTVKKGPNDLINEYRNIVGEGEKLANTLLSPAEWTKIAYAVNRNQEATKEIKSTVVKSMLEQAANDQEVAETVNSSQKDRVALVNAANALTATSASDRVNDISKAMLLTGFLDPKSYVVDENKTVKMQKNGKYEPVNENWKASCELVGCVRDGGF